MNRLVKLLERDKRRIEVKVERFNSSGGVAGLGDRPFVSYYCYSSSSCNDSEVLHVPTCIQIFQYIRSHKN